MRKNVLISLVSQQTLPNLELIKEFQDFIDEYLFVHTEETINQMNDIIKAAKITDYKEMYIKPFSIQDIEEKLSQYDFQDNDYYVNITGGTKIMIVAFLEFFKNLGAKIYYLTGHKCQYLKIFPVIGKREFILRSRISIEEYLLAYGFSSTPGNTVRPFEQSQKLLSFFLKNDIEKFQEEISSIRDRRGKNLILNENISIQNFIKKIDFIPTNPEKLDKYETRYLSGDWFEEYIYYKLKEELKLGDSEIGIGYYITKGNTSNEIDVIFIYQNKLYIIECKTSVIERRLLDDGKTKKINLLSEIIYKSDALRSKFGLFANTFIVTLEEMRQDDGSPISNYKSHFNRAELSRITILSKKDFQSQKTLCEIFKIS